MCSHCKADKLTMIASEYDLQQLIRTPTRVTETSETLIDL